MIDSQWLYVYRMAVPVQPLRPTLVAFFALLGRFSEIRQSYCFLWINIRFCLPLLLHQSVLAG